MKHLFAIEVLFTWVSLWLLL